MSDGRIAEHLVVRDDLGMMLQTGAIACASLLLGRATRAVAWQALPTHSLKTTPPSQTRRQNMLLPRFFDLCRKVDHQPR